MKSASQKPRVSMDIIIIRARIIFLIILFLNIFSPSAAVYVGYKTGELERSFFKPIRQKYASFVLSLKKAAQEPEKLSFPSYDLDIPTPTVTPIVYKTEVNFQYAGGEVVVTVKPFEFPKYQDNSKATEEWWRQAQEENRRKSEESKRQLEEFRQQSQQKMDAFKQQSQQGRIDFEAQIKAAQEEFKKQYGF